MVKGVGGGVKKGAKTKNKLKSVYVFVCVSVGAWVWEAGAKMCQAQPRELSRKGGHEDEESEAPLFHPGTFAFDDVRQAYASGWQLSDRFVTSSRHTWRIRSFPGTHRNIPEHIHNERGPGRKSNAIRFNFNDREHARCKTRPPFSFHQPGGACLETGMLVETERDLFRKVD